MASSPYPTPKAKRHVEPRCASCGHFLDDHDDGGTGPCGVGSSGMSERWPTPCDCSRGVAPGLAQQRTENMRRGPP